MWFSREKLADNLYGIGEFKHLEQVHSYLLLGEKKNILIDSGMGVEDIKKYVLELSDKPTYVINTHSHFDHIGGNFLFDEVRGVSHVKMCNRQKGYSHAELAKYFRKEEFLELPSFDFDQYSITPFYITSFFAPEDTISEEPFSLRVLSTPGHSVDSLSFFEEDNGWLFCGDLFYDGTIFIDDIEAYRHSLCLLQSLTIKQVFPGHNSLSLRGDILQGYIRYFLGNYTILQNGGVLEYQNIRVEVKKDIF